MLAFCTHETRFIIRHAMKICYAIITLYVRVYILFEFTIPEKNNLKLFYYYLKRHYNNWMTYWRDAIISFQIKNIPIKTKKYERKKLGNNFKPLWFIRKVILRFIQMYQYFSIFVFVFTNIYFEKFYFKTRVFSHCSRTTISV